MKKGNVVISKAGRDKNSWFIILNVNDNIAFIADGKSRKIEKPKKKNIKHLQKTNIFLDEAIYENNKRLRIALYKLITN